ncbi:MAG: hypothetical protein WBA12_00370 [Catalinimonas sp.]
MNIFNIFRRRAHAAGQNQTESDVPKELFVDDTEPTSDPGTPGQAADLNGIASIYRFMQKDYETQGYHDALTNPDDSYRSDNVEMIKLDLKLLIDRAELYYRDQETETDLHITTRGRAGLIDVVQELQTRKQMISEHIAKVERIKQDLASDNGTSHRMALSYQRGFSRGLAALTQSLILKNKLS